MKFIFSTMSNDTEYTIYKKNAEKHSIPDGSILINGKANVMNKRLLIIKNAVMTKITDEEYARIKDDYHFKKHIEKGFLTVTDKQVQEEKVAKDLTKKDKSAQKTKADYSKDVKAEIAEVEN